MQFPVNVRDLTDEDLTQLPETVVKAIEQFERLGYKREHLVIGSEEDVFFDPELCTIDGFLGAMNFD